jgi:hypothetical protein
MRVAHWIQLNIGALGNEGVQKLARCLKHQLQHWAHFAFVSAFSQHSSECLCVWLIGFSSVLGRDVIKENYRPDVRGRRPDVRPHLRSPRGRGFTRGRVFTVRPRGKNRARADMGVREDAKMK